MNIQKINYTKHTKNSNQKFNFSGKTPQKLSSDVYFIRMQGYEKNQAWAKKMLEGTYEIADAIKHRAKFPSITTMARDTVIRAYYAGNNELYQSIYEKFCKNPFVIEDNGKRGSEYYKKYMSKFKGTDIFFKPKSNKEYKDAGVSQFKRCDSRISIKEGWSWNTDNLHLAEKEYEKLHSPIFNISSKKQQQQKINRIAATIQWLIAQESPWFRGSDSIANLITKSIYLAKNMEITPIKKGLSFDFEAWYQDLDDYIKIYPDLFEQPPRKI